MYYWELKWGKYPEPIRSVLIPPDKVEVIKRRWGNGDLINLSTSSIPANQIKSFEMTDKPYTEQRLIDAVAQAFKEPVLSGEAIGSRWVKLNVTQDKWSRFYSVTPGYKNLGEFNGLTVVAFKKAIHDIDVQITPYCDDDEVKQLEK